ncbi:carboxylesterase family protein [Halopseudomonas nanhaiensis]|uniref:carboxylesterase/lipase family protein n=1 Tax=Halopseudomonas nanhaiensis TaxID=2830842 RepID=UPI001CBD92B6|nr:carboxylesterase family protein [Halopseudomonas nanhaiensis]UAW96947.1 carboxylesterase family protein [Halopseudomonas nanhaiensis]
MPLRALTVALLGLSLSACLSGGGSSSNAAAPASADPLTISTTEGEVRGIESGDIRVFRGIPYAAPPVGELRFAPTEAAPERDGVLELSEAFGSMCPQISLLSGQVQGNEDCLFLNVYAPADAEDLPVMIWIHGGAFVFGDGGGEYDPTRLVEKDVIVVTLNYRLGNLGFLAHPSLDSDGGNFGLMDQQEAMRWVKRNIAAFGGDPENVTLFGESAGGHSVMSHIVSPRAEAENLFQRAIVQSGSYAAFQSPKAASQASGQLVASALNCPDAGAIDDCLRSASVSQLLAAQGSQSIPTVDPATDLLPKSIYQSLAEGDFNTTLDVMIGSNQNEGTLFVALDELGGESLEAQGEAEYRNRVAEFFAPYQAVVPYNDDQIASDYLGFYSQSSAQYSEALSAIWTDFMFACNSSAQAATFAGRDMNTFKYWFRDENAPWTLVNPVAVSFPLGATHAGEIPYVLYPEQVMRDRYTGDEADVDRLAETMVDYWTSFARNGDPNTADGVAATWPQAAAGRYMVLDVPEAASTGAADFATYHRCAYWAAPPLRIE